MRWETVRDAGELAERAARRLLAAIAADPRAVLGLPTGTTPVGMYRRLVSACAARPGCFGEVSTFNLDEYVELPPEHPASYRSFMERHLFAHVDLAPERARLPDGNAAAVRRESPALSLEEALAVECLRYERDIAAAGGLSLTVLGLGVNGHIAFNEPGSHHDSRTRVVELAAATRRANAPHFPGDHHGDRHDPGVAQPRAPGERGGQGRGGRAPARGQGQRGVPGLGAAPSPRRHGARGPRGRRRGPHLEARAQPRAPPRRRPRAPARPALSAARLTTPCR